MKLPFRQGIVQYPKNTNKTQQFLQQSGSAVTLVSTNVPTIVSFSHIDAEYLYTEGVTIPNAWSGPFVPGNNYWLYWDINISTGVRTFGFTTYAPIIGTVRPAARIDDDIGLHWFDTSKK